MVQKFLVISFILFALCSCGRYKVIRTDKIVLDKNYKRIEDTLLTDSLEHLTYSRLSKSGSFGMRRVYELPEKSQGKELIVAVSGRCRTSSAASDGMIVVVAHSKKNKQLSWDLIRMKYQFTALNQWCSFRDSIRLPTDFYGTQYNRITVMTHLPNGGEKFDLDGLNIEIREKH